MDPYSSPYIIPNNRLHHSLLRAIQYWTPATTFDGGSALETQDPIPRLREFRVHYTINIRNLQDRYNIRRVIFGVLPFRVLISRLITDLLRPTEPLSKP